MKRVESGPIQFDDDWPGVFIRGDSAFHYARSLRKFFGRLPQDDNDFQLRLERNTVQVMIRALERSNVHGPEYVEADVQKISRVEAV